LWDQNGRNEGSWIEIEVNDDGGVMLPSGMEIKVISIPRVDIGGINISGGGDIGENNGGGINQGSPCRNRRERRQARGPELENVSVKTLCEQILMRMKYTP
jgi:hypothetical protein